MFLLATDSTTDLPKEFLQENGVACVQLSYILDGITYGDHSALESHEFFEMMRQGKMPTTSQVNPEEAKSFFEGLIGEYKEILYLGFSSGLSGSFNSCRMAALEIMEEHPDCTIEVIDTLSASLGEGLLVYKALELQKQGKSMAEVKAWIEEHKLEVVHLFTVDDLFHLARGGRVSKATAVIGTLASIKPMLHVDDEGHLINVAKVRGRKKALNTLVDQMVAAIADYPEENTIFMISHGDVLEDAEYVRDLMIQKTGIQNFLINSLGPVIGAHTGPGLVALFCMGNKR